MKHFQKAGAAIVAASLISSMLLCTACKNSEETKSTTSATTTTVEQTTTTTIEETTTEATTETTTEATTEATTKATTADPNVFEFTEANYPKLDGSTSTKPMAAAITSVLLGISREEAENKLEFHKTSQSFSYLMSKDADMLICAEPADSVFKDMKDQNFEYVMEPFATEALVFVVNASNPVESLTTEQIQKIYTGEITNWKEVGGEDRKIVPIQRNKTAGSQVMMEKIVMKDLTMMEAPTELVVGDMGGLIETVKSFDNSADAIGYTPYYYATNMKMADGLKIIKVDDIMPAKDTIQKGEYPFRTSYYVVMAKGTPEDSPTSILFNWVLGPDGQKLAEMEGYVPVN